MVQKENFYVAVNLMITNQRRKQTTDKPTGFASGVDHKWIIAAIDRGGGLILLMK